MITKKWQDRSCQATARGRILAWILIWRAVIYSIRPGLLAQGAEIGIYWQAALYHHLKTIITKCFAAQHPCVCLNNKKERWRWRGMLYGALAGWRLLSMLTRQYLIHAAGHAVQSATALQECLRPKYGLFWCLPGIDIRATYFLVQSVWNHSFLQRTRWKKAHERLQPEQWIIITTLKTLGPFDTVAFV